MRLDKISISFAVNQYYVVIRNNHMTKLVWLFLQIYLEK